MIQEGTTGDLGITISFVYVVLFSYVYMSMHYRTNKLGFSVMNYKRNFIMSNAFFNSEKVGTSILIILITLLATYMIHKQNFNKYPIGIAASSIILSLGFGLVLFMFSIKKKNIKFIHSTIAAVMFIGGQVFAYIALYLYDKSFILWVGR